MSRRSAVSVAVVVAAVVAAGCFWAWRGDGSRVTMTNVPPSASVDVRDRDDVEIPVDDNDVDDAEPVEPATGRTIFLEVKSPDESPISGAAVLVMAITGEKELGFTDDDGVLVIPRDPPRPLKVRATGFLDRTVSPPTFPDEESVAWSITLDNAGTSNVIGVVKSGTVVVVGATVIATGLDASVLAVTHSDGGGRFALAPPNISAFTVVHRGHGVTSVDLAKARAGRNESSATIEVTLPLSASVHGRVVDGRGNPMPAFTVRLALPRPDANTLSLLRGLRRDKTELGRRAFDALSVVTRPVDEASKSDDGSFVIAPILSGRHESLAAFARGKSPAVLDGLTLSPGEERRGIVLVIGEPATLTGTVRDQATGEPVNGALVELTRWAGQSAEGFGRAGTDENGAFTVPIEPDVRQTLRVTARGYLPLEEGGIEARENGSLHRDVELRRAKGKKGGRSKEYTGIGTVIRQHDDGVEILDVIPGPAKDVLQKGDVVARVDGVWLEGLPLETAVERITGEPGSEVEMIVYRPSTVPGEPPEELTLVLERTRIEFTR